MTNRRRQRLRLDAYHVDGATWHITTAGARRNGEPFRSIEFGQQVLDGFARSCQSGGAHLHLIRVMPNHLHTVIEIRTDDLVKVVGRTKSATTRLWWERGGVGALWQQSFHDHGIRGPQDFEATVTYLLNNPVEAGLVEEWTAYPLFGGVSISGDR